MIKNIFLILGLLLIVGCNDNSEIDYASQKEKNIQLKIELSECTLSINGLKMLDIQKDEIKNKESLNELVYEDLQIENNQLAISLQECKSKLKEREVRENEKAEARDEAKKKENARAKEKKRVRARDEAKKKEKSHVKVEKWALRENARDKAKKKSTENGNTISCKDAAKTILSYYKKALLYLKKGMRKKADIIYQVSVKDKRTFMLVCKNTPYPAVFKNVEDVENALLKNSIVVNANKLQDIAIGNIKILSERQRVLENGIQRENERHERKMKSIERERKQKMDEYNRKIKALERL